MGQITYDLPDEIIAMIVPSMGYLDTIEGKPNPQTKEEYFSENQLNHYLSIGKSQVKIKTVDDATAAAKVAAEQAFEDQWNQKYPQNAAEAEIKSQTIKP